MFNGYFYRLAAILLVANLDAAPPKYSYGQESVHIREMQSCIDDFRHEIANHENEIRTFEEKLANTEVIIESLREQNASLLKSNQDSQKNSLANLEMRLNSFDTSLKGLFSDFKELKAHLTESQQRRAEVEKIVKAQGEHLELFQSALNSIMTVLEVKHDLKPGDEGKVKTHRVQPGDSLEKIAKLYKTTIKAIKEVNDLNGDRIIVGQNIKIP